MPDRALASEENAQTIILAASPVDVFIELKVPWSHWIETNDSALAHLRPLLVAADRQRVSDLFLTEG